MTWGFARWRARVAPQSVSIDTVRVEILTAIASLKEDISRDLQALSRRLDESHRELYAEQATLMTRVSFLEHEIEDLKKAKEGANSSFSNRTWEYVKTALFVVISVVISYFLPKP